jgi:hypothetical protein
MTGYRGRIAEGVRYAGYLNTAPFGADFFEIIHNGAASPKRDTMENHRVEELRDELNHLLGKQNEVLELRSFGGATDTDILEYEIRQDVIDEICNQLAKCAAA